MKQRVSKSQEKALKGVDRHFQQFIFDYLYQKLIM